MLIQQYHKKDKLGQITLHKYQKFGPHILHFLIHTHWKIFKKGKHSLCFKWEIKFIKGKLPQSRGRPTIQFRNSSQYQQFRQKMAEYNTPTFQKIGTANLFINPDSKKVSLRRDSKTWMRSMLQQVLPIFLHKTITNNRVESKHSQIKRTGNLRKQTDGSYGDLLFQLQEFIVQHGYLPEVTLEGRPLYKYLILPVREKQKGYVFHDNNKKLIQTVLTGYP